MNYSWASDMKRCLLGKDANCGNAFFCQSAGQVTRQQAGGRLIACLKGHSFLCHRVSICQSLKRNSFTADAYKSIGVLTLHWAVFACTMVLSSTASPNWLTLGLLHSKSPVWLATFPDVEQKRQGVSQYFYRQPFGYIFLIL